MKSIQVYVKEIVVGDTLDGDGSTITKVSRKADDPTQVILHCHNSCEDYTVQYGEDDTEWVIPPVIITV